MKLFSCCIKPFNLFFCEVAISHAFNICTADVDVYNDVRRMLLGWLIFYSTRCLETLLQFLVNFILKFMYVQVRTGTWAVWPSDYGKFQQYTRSGFLVQLIIWVSKRALKAGNV